MCNSVNLQLGAKGIAEQLTNKLSFGQSQWTEGQCFCMWQINLFQSKEIHTNFNFANLYLGVVQLFSFKPWMYQLKCIPNSSIASSNGPHKSQRGNALQNARFPKDVDATAFLFLMHRIDHRNELLNCADGVRWYGWRAGWAIIHVYNCIYYIVVQYQS